ncbi:MAG TPA: LPS export ABC transporter periplasmic protein LptC [Salinivirgaceae bacterium]|nr:LPS export ABC transporter periplasmic protein LptC [Salinivirgaceae bacterium]
MKNLLNYKKLKMAILTIAIFSLLSSCAPGIDQVRNIPDITEMPTLSAKNITLFHSQYGKTRLRIQASTVNVFSMIETPKTEFLEGIYVEFLSDSLTATSFFKADKAIYFEKENRWEATGNIEAMNIEGTRFNTEFIEWDERTGLIQSNQYIKVTDKETIIVGNGFKAKQDFTDWKILNPTGIFTIDQKD